MLQRTLYSLLIGSVAVLGIVVIWALPTHSAEPPSIRTPQLLGERQFASWSYRAYEEGYGFVGLYPEITKYSQAGTEAFMAENARFAKDFFAQQELAEGLIRFRHPVPFEALPALITADPTHVREYYLEYTPESGEVGTIGGAPKGDVFLPRDELQAWEAIAATNSGEGKTEGFTRIVMDMTRDEYEALVQEADVWFVDVTVEYAIQDALQQGFAAKKELLSAAYPFPYEPVVVSAPTPYYLE